MRIEIRRCTGSGVLGKRLGVTLIDPIDEFKHLIQRAIFVSQKRKRSFGESQRERNHGASEFRINFLIVFEAIVTIIKLCQEKLNTMKRIS